MVLLDLKLPKIDGLEVFDADRHAGRVLGMGDIVALVEQVTAGVDLAQAQKLAAKDPFDVLIVGGGPVAAAKLEGLLAAGAKVTVVAPARNQKGASL